MFHNKVQSISFGISKMSDDLHKNFFEEFEKEFLKNIKIDFPLNSKEDDVPFGYVNPKFTEGTMYWMCGKDEDEKITSVFGTSTSKEKAITYLTTVQEAVRFKNELVRDGWQPIKPKIEFSFKKEK